MFRRLVGPLLMAMCAMPGCAAAWTLEVGQRQLQFDTLVSAAGHGFDGTRLDFAKVYVKSASEYGLLDSVTLVMDQEFAAARWRNDDFTGWSRSYAFRIGARYSLYTDDGVLSLQTLVGNGRGINGTVSQQAQSGELRLLYGRNIAMLGCDGFVGLEAASAWIGRSRPEEFAVDAVAGLWLNRRFMAMIQSFNTLRSGEGNYSLAKLEVSLVGRLAPGWSLRLGAMMAPIGTHAAAERGINLSLWVEW